MTATAADAGASSGLPRQLGKQSASLNLQPILPAESAPALKIQPGLMNFLDSQSRRIVADADADATRHETQQSSTDIQDKRTTARSS